MEMKNTFDVNEFKSLLQLDDLSKAAVYLEDFLAPPREDKASAAIGVIAAVNCYLAAKVARLNFAKERLAILKELENLESSLANTKKLNQIRAMINKL